MEAEIFGVLIITALGSFTQPPHWICQDILKLRERESSYDIVTCGYGMRNLADIPMALRLAYTLLKP
ncbi:class I SAM-dependent methyltransferase, partial [Campylobacter avium]|uniref:class I SAM-dependent methyltransferase n=1 Tax=Campylobacter avium TaxID=522485 RepID=UPI00248D3013